jgi:hypothetical protein
MRAEITSILSVPTPLAKMPLGTLIGTLSAGGRLPHAARSQALDSIGCAIVPPVIGTLGTMAQCVSRASLPHPVGVAHGTLPGELIEIEGNQHAR